jgi:riboflavin synthase
MTIESEVINAPSKRRISHEEEDDDKDQDELVHKKHKKLENAHNAVKLLLPFDTLTKRLQ